MKPQVYMSEQEETEPHFTGITDDSLRRQIGWCAKNIAGLLKREDWPGIEGSAKHAAQMDAELRRRHNERTFPARKARTTC